MGADIIIIGAGACGLMAARELSKENKSVLVLEALGRTGGRIHTIYSEGTEQHMELGAEFVHGKLPVTLGLLKEAGLGYYATADEMWRSDEEGMKQEEDFIEGWDVLMKKLSELEEDISVNDFLERHFAEDKYTELRESVKSYAEGYDTADPTRASILALREEWKEAESGHNYRTKDGYGKMLAYLEDEFKKNGGEIHLSTVVSGIEWEKGEVSITTSMGKTYQCRKVIVTVPLGVLQSEKNARGHISISPALPDYEDAIAQMGFGNVIKVLMHFTNRFWESDIVKKVAGKRMDDAGFIFSDQPIPTWWTQNPEKSSLLTGWLGGTKAKQMSTLSDEDIMAQAVKSLSAIFNLSEDTIRNMISYSKIVNWNTALFTRGSYSYPTVGVNKARMTMGIPVDDTIYFAGESIWHGTEAGTVEAALGSGKAVAKSILRTK